MRVLKTAAAAAAAIALLTAPAYAQFNMGGNAPSSKTRYSDEEKRNEAAAEKAYRDTIKNTKGASNEAHDPWRNMRPANPPAKTQR